jgi:hypothetical protein
MTQEQEQEFLQAIAKGQRAKEILSCPCWKKDIEPYIQGRIIDLSRGSSWRPGGSSTTDLTAMGCAYNGGREDECNNLSNILLIWIKQGEIAAEKLEKERGKHK